MSLKRGTGGVTSPIYTFLPKLLHFGGAVLSVVLVGGFIYWGVKISTRDPHYIPIIEAMEGPSREAPRDPGGRSAEFQGLEVNALLTNGTRSEIEEARIAPEGISLADEDQPLSESAIEQALLEAQARQESAELGAADVEVVEAVLGRSGPQRGAPLYSLRPLPRPVHLERPERPQSATEASAAQSDLAAYSPSSDFSIQLGAYNKESDAERAWSFLAARHDDLIRGRQHYIQKATANGQIFYRLRVDGFDSLNMASNACAEFKARGAGCTPARAR